LTKAEGAYGEAVRIDLEKAIHRLQDRQGWLEHCIQAMAMTIPKALVWQKGTHVTQKVVGLCEDLK